MHNYYITSGNGKGNTLLTSFDNALLDSGVANYNLVKISSILPAGCTEQSDIDLKEGFILHTAYATLTSNKKGETICAAIGVAIPQDEDKVGVIMEYANYCSKEEAISIIDSMLMESTKNRGYDIKEIKRAISETVASEKNFSTVFASLSIW